MVKDPDDLARIALPGRGCAIAALMTGLVVAALLALFVTLMGDAGFDFKVTNRCDSSIHFVLGSGDPPSLDRDLELTMKPQRSETYTLLGRRDEDAYFALVPEPPAGGEPDYLVIERPADRPIDVVLAGDPCVATAR